MKHSEKTFAVDPKNRCERGVTLTVEVDQKALADHAMTGIGRKLELYGGAIKVSLRTPKR